MAADNPNGKVPLNLPTSNKLENLPDPKGVLFEKLRNTHRQTVHAWEQALAKLTDETMLLVAKALNTSVSYLYGETKRPGPDPEWDLPGTAVNEAQARALESARVLREIAALLESQGYSLNLPGLPDGFYWF